MCSLVLYVAQKFLFSQIRNVEQSNNFFKECSSMDICVFMARQIAEEIDENFYLILFPQFLRLNKIIIKG
jgi:hypothetical protein